MTKTALLWMGINTGGPDPRFDPILEICISGTEENVSDLPDPVKRSTVCLHTPMEDPFLDPKYREKHDQSGLRAHWRDLFSYGNTYTGKKSYLQHTGVVERRILNIFDTRGFTGPLTLAGAGVEARVLPFLRVWMPLLTERLTENVFDTSLVRRLFYQDRWPDRAAWDVQQAIEEGFDMVRMAELLRRHDQLIKKEETTKP